LGVTDPVTKNMCGNEAVYFEKLAEEISALLLEPLKECGGTMSLIETYCFINRVNRLRNVELISPEDLLNSCKRFEDLDLPISLTTFDSGVIALQLKSKDDHVIGNETMECVGKMGSANPSLLSKELGISVVMAMERLLLAESQSKLCRDETDEGLMFYPNQFEKQSHANNHNAD